MREEDNYSKTREIEIMIEKLLNPVDEIQWRALENILSKLNYGLININILIEFQSGKLINYLLKWFLKNSHSQAEFKIVLTFLHKVIKETTNGLRILINAGARNILQAWIRAHLENEEITNLVRDICSELITATKMKESNNAQDLQYGENCTIQSSEIRDDCSTAENSITLSTNSISSPARFLMKNRDNYHGSRIPDHLLDPVVSSDHSTAQSTQNGNRIYSPITRSYLKRKVTFSQLPEDSTFDDNTINSESIIQDIFPFSSLLSEWHTMEKVDRDLLHEVAQRLKNSELAGVKYALQEISSFVLEDFPTELLLQRPNILFMILDILIQETNFSAKISSVGCLEKIVRKLQSRINFCSDTGLIGRSSSDKHFGDSLLSNHERHLDFQGKFNISLP